MVAEGYNDFCRCFSNLQGKISTVIAAFNFQPWFNFSAAIHYFTFQCWIIIFNIQLLFLINSQPWFSFSMFLWFPILTTIRLFNTQQQFQLSTAICILSVQLWFYHSLFNYWTFTSPWTCHLKRWLEEHQLSIEKLNRSGKLKSQLDVASSDKW